MEITFKNHAWFSIKHNGSISYTDPWFFGRVFNDSWELITEHTPCDEELKKLKYIFITHEHPDHFHVPTLKYIRKKTEGQKISIVVVKQKKDNLKEAISRLGYDLVEVDMALETVLETDFSCTFLNAGPGSHDNTITYRGGGKTIVNQNDCDLTEGNAQQIKDTFGSIDVWLRQFSLAGYYGNEDDTNALEHAHSEKIQYFKKCYNIFKPKMAVPFASFVRFCRNENKYINDYIVHLDEIAEEIGWEKLQVLQPNDKLFWKGNFHISRSKHNAEKWKSLFKEDFELFVPEEGSEDELLEVMRSNIPETGPDGKGHAFIIGLKDTNTVLVWDIEQRTVTPFQKNPKEPPHFDMPIHDLMYIFKFPWGADTANIAACTTVYHKNPWNAFISNLHALYLPDGDAWTSVFNKPNSEKPSWMP